MCVLWWYSGNGMAEEVICMLTYSELSLAALAILTVSLLSLLPPSLSFSFLLNSSIKSLSHFSSSSFIFSQLHFLLHRPSLLLSSSSSSPPLTLPSSNKTSILLYSSNSQTDHYHHHHPHIYTYLTSPLTRLT